MGKFPDILKKLMLNQFMKKTTGMTNKTIVQSVHYLIYQKYPKNLFTLKFIHA